MIREQIFILLSAPAIAWIWLCAKMTGQDVMFRWGDDDDNGEWKQL